LSSRNERWEPLERTEGNHITEVDSNCSHQEKEYTGRPVRN